MTPTTTPAAEAVSLHDQIMNLVRSYEFEGKELRIAYAEGHREARHAAAELAATREQQHALELLSLEGQAMEREGALIAERDQLRAVAHVAIAWAHASDIAATAADLAEESDFDPELVEASTKADEAFQAAEVDLFEACRALAAPAVEGE